MEISERHEVWNGKNSLSAAEFIAGGSLLSLYDFCRRYKLGYGIVDINDTDRIRGRRRPTIRIGRYTFCAQTGQKIKFQLAFDSGITSRDAIFAGIIREYGVADIISDDTAKAIPVFALGMCNLSGAVIDTIGLPSPFE